MKNTELSKWADEGANALQRAVDKATDRKRKLGQYWVEWDGERHADTCWGRVYAGSGGGSNVGVAWQSGKRKANHDRI